MRIHIVGMGMGSIETLTAGARSVILSADIAVGARRLIDALPGEGPAKRYEAVAPDKIVRLIKAHPEAGSVCVLMSGDTGFYSGAAGLLPLLDGFETEVLPGISSVQYFAAKLRRPWQDWKLVSAHGKACDAPGIVRRNGATFFLTGGALTVQALCAQLDAAGLGSCPVAVGEKLGSAEERVVMGTAASHARTEFDSLAVMLADNPDPRRTVSCGLPDGAFTRGDIPMTKSEVRSVILSKLRLNNDDTVYDVGAGTGSVSVEAALLMKNGHVYAFEREPEGCRLIEENAKRLGASNLTCTQGSAPASFAGFPPPDAAFIGGSGGNLLPVLERLLMMNPNVRLVVSAVTLETLAEAASAFSRLPIADTEIVQIAVSRAKPLGEYHLLTAQNPVFIISGAGKND